MVAEQKVGCLESCGHPMTSGKLLVNESMRV